MDGADQLGLSFGCLELHFCTGGGGVDPDDDVTDDNKVIFPGVSYCENKNCCFTAVPLLLCFSNAFYEVLWKQHCDIQQRYEVLYAVSPHIIATAV